MSTDEYTPTTEQVRSDYVQLNEGGEGAEEARAAFDRWLAQHDREVKAAAAERECLKAGSHLRVVRMAHHEVCERPWDVAHKAQTVDQVDMVCRHCDSDWLTAPDDFTEHDEENGQPGEVKAADGYEAFRERHPEYATEPIIRYATLDDGTVELDEVIGYGWMHLEKMNTAQWWIGLTVGGDTWHINLGAVNPRVKDYAHIEGDL